MNIAPFLLTLNELTTIQTLHHCRVGWSYLLMCTFADKQMGFLCRQQEQVIRKQLSRSREKVSAWFSSTGRKYHWPQSSEIVWEVDFIQAKVIPRGINSESANLHKCQEEGCHLSRRFIMPLGECDMEIIRRLQEKREAIADLLRTHISECSYEDSNQITTSDTLAERLGQAHVQVNQWYHAMAQQYGWPELKNSQMGYRVDFNDKCVYLTVR